MSLGRADLGVGTKDPTGWPGRGLAATYKDGVLEIRIPEPKHEPAKKIAISKS